jgi:ABC-2 type transport system permease protein
MLLINNIVFGFIQFSILKIIGNYSVIINNKILAYVLSVIIIKEVTFSDVYKGIENDYQRGKILFVLSKPIDIQTYYMLNLLSDFLFNLIKVIPFILFYIMLYKNSINYFGLFLFIMDLSIIFVIINIVLMIFSLLSFSSYFNTGIIQIYNFIFMIFSGLLLPFDLFPKWFFTIANLLPFKYLGYKPILELFLNNSANVYAFLSTILVPQIIILILTYIIFAVVSNAVKKKILIFG